MMIYSLSIEDACAATGFGKTKLYEAINAGRLKAKKHGRRTIILTKDLEEFLSTLEEYPSKTQGDSNE